MNDGDLSALSNEWDAHHAYVTLVRRVASERAQLQADAEVATPAQRRLRAALAVAHWIGGAIAPLLLFSVFLGRLAQRWDAEERGDASPSYLAVFTPLFVAGGCFVGAHLVAAVVARTDPGPLVALDHWRLHQAAADAGTAPLPRAFASVRAYAAMRHKEDGVPAFLAIWAVIVGLLVIVLPVTLLGVAVDSDAVSTWGRALAPLWVAIPALLFLFSPLLPEKSGTDHLVDVAAMVCMSGCSMLLITAILLVVRLDGVRHIAYGLVLLPIYLICFDGVMLGLIHRATGPHRLDPGGPNRTAAGALVSWGMPLVFSALVTRRDQGLLDVSWHGVFVPWHIVVAFYLALAVGAWALDPAWDGQRRLAQLLREERVHRFRRTQAALLWRDATGRGGGGAAAGV
jgi:hypothetical protein